MVWRRILFTLLVLSVLFPPMFASEKEKEAAATLIERAKQLSDIRSQRAPPFRLKLNFRILEEDGSIGRASTPSSGPPARNGAEKP